jgi:hypothetical protein
MKGRIVSIEISDDDILRIQTTLLDEQIEKVLNQHKEDNSAAIYEALVLTYPRYVTEKIN